MNSKKNMESVNKIIWTESAKFTFEEILEFLKFKWGQKQIDDFYFLTEKTINRIQENPFQFPIYTDSNTIYRALIHPNVSLFFRVDQLNEEIYLMFFFDNRKRPMQFL